MARPDVSATTERIYAALPQEERNADEDQADGANGYPQLRYLSLLGDQAGELEVLLDRFNFVAPRDGGAAGDTSDLADPATADVAWLAWLAMHPGVDVAAMTPGEARVAIDAEQFIRGSHDQLLAAIRTRLSGAQRATLIPNLGADQWLLGVQIHPDDLDIASWTTIEADFGTWDQIEAAGSWEAIGAVDAIDTAIVAASKPAGVELINVPAGSWWSIETLGSWTAIEALGSWSAIEFAPF